VKTAPPLFCVGDFVACDQEFVTFLDYIYEDEDIDWLVYYGIVLDVDATYHYYMDEYVYEILCLDGEKRFFMESELKKV
tara:strand:- start:7 stop:243 length:237 start_codon:yes stop_codon:yes gene_type:complete